MKRALTYVILLAVWRFADFASSQETPIPPRPEKIIRKAIDARGGKDALAKYLTCRVRAKGLMFNGDHSAPMHFIYLYRYPNHTKLIGDVRLPEGGLATTINVFDGKRAWTKRNGNTTEASDSNLLEARMGAYDVYVRGLFPLLDQDRFKLTALPVIQIKDKDVASVLVSSKDYGDIRLYFDKKTWLLVKSERKCEEQTRKGTLYEEYFGEYKKLKGVMYPTKITTVIGGKKRFEKELIDIEPLTKIDDSEFSKP